MSNVEPSIRFTGKRLLNVVEAGQYLGISPQTLYNRCSKKSANPFPVKCRRIGASVRFDLRDLDAYIDSLSLD